MMFSSSAYSGDLFTALSARKPHLACGHSTTGLSQVVACDVDAYPKTPIRVRIRATIQLNQ
ncbi:hypothetical protein N9L73_05450 [Luminiphilus sp.]|nr:hypothetical protein [Luminiphilus sp.]